MNVLQNGIGIHRQVGKYKQVLEYILWCWSPDTDVPSNLDCLNAYVN